MSLTFYCYLRYNGLHEPINICLCTIFSDISRTFSGFGAVLMNTRLRENDLLVTGKSAQTLDLRLGKSRIHKAFGMSLA